jgi:hypothetical protein
VSGDADGGAAEAEVVVPAQGDVVSLAGLSLPGVASAVRAAVEVELVEAELLKAELAEATELGRDSRGGEAGGGFGGSEGSGLGVHLRSAGGAGRERGVPCGVCLMETWNVCAICDSCHSECRPAR